MLNGGGKAQKSAEEAVKSADASKRDWMDVDFLVKIKLKQDITLVKIYDSTFKMTFDHQKSYFLNFKTGIYFWIYMMSLESPKESPQMDSIWTPLCTT